MTDRVYHRQVNIQDMGHRNLCGSSDPLVDYGHDVTCSDCLAIMRYYDLSPEQQEQSRQLGLNWLSEIQARDESAEFHDAEAYAIVVTTEESGTMTWVHGPVSNHIEALRLAEIHEGQLNQGLAENDAPFVAKVYPMNKPDGWDL